MKKEEIKAEILVQETKIDQMLQSGAFNQETAWDMYFCLLHECDTQELWEWDARKRILSKIDRKKYNPFNSKNENIRAIAFIRAHLINDIAEYFASAVAEKN